MATAVVCSEHGLPDKLSLGHDWEAPQLGPNDVVLKPSVGGLSRCM